MEEKGTIEEGEWRKSSDIEIKKVMDHGFSFPQTFPTFFHRSYI